MLSTFYFIEETEKRSTESRRLLKSFFINYINNELLISIHIHDMLKTIVWRESAMVMLDAGAWNSVINSAKKRPNDDVHPIIKNTTIKFAEKKTFFNPKNTWNLTVKKENVFINYRIYLTYKDDPSPSSIDRYHIFSFCCHHFVSL